MEFKKRTEQVQILTPPDFTPEVQRIEYREDPLTGSHCLINIKRAERARQAERIAHPTDEIGSGTAPGCFFCPENIPTATPRFPEDICPSGRLEKGECVLFPNLFAFGGYHAVATLSRKHMLDTDEFTAPMIEDNLSACIEWMRAVHRKTADAVWPIYVWNHMPPSGASMVHPHTQALVRTMPTTMQEHLLKRSRAYYEREGRTFWNDLIEAERESGDRFIGENDSLAIVASFAPRGFREIQLIFREPSSLTDLGEKHITDLADALVRILRAYKSMGVGSFNVNLFSGPIGERLPHYPLNARVISRPYPRGVYSSDTGPFERLQDEWVIETLPEEVARRMRPFFQ